MNGNFEVSHSAWPIGYLRSGSIFGSGNTGPLYKLTNMNTLEPVLPDDFSQEKVIDLAAQLNLELRSSKIRRDEVQARAIELTKGK